MPVRISHLHLAGPRKVLWRVENAGACGPELFVQRLHVGDAYPYPCSGLALVSIRQVDGSIVSRDAGEVVTTPLGVGETEHLDVVPEASRHVGHVQYRVRAFECRPRDGRLPHGTFS